MTVQLDACIHCQLCVQACRDIQANDVIGMAGRGAAAKIVFDVDDAMGDSICVGCGECVQACPTGALMATTMLAADGSDFWKKRMPDHERWPLFRRLKVSDFEYLPEQRAWKFRQ